MRRTIPKFLGAIVAGLVLSIPSSSATGQALTFTNPTPTAYDGFGISVASVGSERVLIGAYRNDTGATNAGAAYLFHANGALLTSFTNPTPAANDNFGNSVAAVGTDRILVGVPSDNTGAPDAGMACLFSTNGTLLLTITNPVPNDFDFFGVSVASMGPDRLLIGSYFDDVGATDAGAAYLFDSNGALLTTFTNPVPTAVAAFGFAIAALGTDRVIVGAYGANMGAIAAGAAYVFGTNGTLLTTISNPTPATLDYFGYAVAAVGTNRILIGAYGDNTEASDAGAGYLFASNGSLLTTLTNPAPGVGDQFGRSVAAVGTDRVLIGAHQDDAGANDAGAAYLFGTDGTLLTVLTNPAPVASNLFGSSVAALSTNRALVGALQDDTGTTDAGAAYLFNLKAPVSPSLSISYDPQFSTVTLSWPAPAEGWLLEHTNALPSEPMVSWPQIPPPYQTNGEAISVTLTNPPATENQFFRLHKP